MKSQRLSCNACKEFGNAWDICEKQENITLRTYIRDTLSWQQRLQYGKQVELMLHTVNRNNEKRTEIVEWVNKDYTEITINLCWSEGIEKTLYLRSKGFYQIPLTNNNEKYPLYVFGEIPLPRNNFMPFTLKEWSLISIYKAKNDQELIKEIPKQIVHRSFNKSSIESGYPKYRVCEQNWKHNWNSSIALIAQTTMPEGYINYRT
jgi:hypothetical protein